MLIGIDGQALYKTKSGLGIYTEQLVSNLKKIDSKNEYLLITKSKRLGERTYERLIWENVVLPTKALRRKINLLHTPAFSAPFWKGKWRTVVTIHDLIGIIFPHNLSFSSRFYWGSWLPFVNRFSERIIVDSNCTKQDVIKYLRIDPNKIRVIYLAAPDHFTNHRVKNQIDQVCQKFGVQRPYLLFVGNIEPRKNLLRVIQAFSKVKKIQKLEHTLVLVGFKAWDYLSVAQLIKELSLTHVVRYLNYVDDEDLISLYNGGDLFVFPSLYEGFGIPILEAMKCGMPVLTSNLSSMPEVAGDAAYYVNPYREEEIEDALKIILTDPKLQNDLRSKGLAQAAKFDWKRTAEETLGVYQELFH